MLRPPTVKCVGRKAWVSLFQNTSFRNRGLGCSMPRKGRGGG